MTRKFIRPRTPVRNGKVGRSHGIDRKKFHRRISFCSLDDLAGQGAASMGKYDETPRIVLNLRSQNQAELEKLTKLMQDTSEVRCPKPLKCFASTEN